MKPISPTASILTAAALAAALLVSGCGGGGGSLSSADSQEITRLVGELNRVTAEGDAAGFCDVMQPSGVKASFNTRSRCVKETTQILKLAGPQPVLNIEDIDVDGDTATVKLEGSVGELNLAREDGEWYVAFADTSPGSAGSGSLDSASSGSTATGISGDAAGSGDAGSGGG